MIIFFDLDDTLYSSRELRAARQESIYKALFNKLKISRESLEQKFFDKKKELKEKNMQSNSLSVFSQLGMTKEEFYNAIDEVDPSKFLKESEELKKVLSELNKKNRMFVFTNSPGKSAGIILEKLGILNFIERVFAGDEMEYQKPTRESFNCVLLKSNANPRDCVMVGNSIEKDLSMAKKLGMKTVCIGKFVQTDVVDNFISSIGELVDFL